MFPLNPVPATPYVEQLSIGAGRRTLALSLAVLIPAILLLLLLSYGVKRPPGIDEKRLSVVNLSAPATTKKASEPSSPAQEQAQKRLVTPQPAAEMPQPPTPTPSPPPPVPPILTKPSERPPLPASPPAPARPSNAPVYGPPDNRSRSSSAFGDSEQVGTAPNGEPLYAASWYREPTNDELRGYLSTASGPGWGLIACRTAPDYRVEECVGLDEYPSGSQINRAVLAAAWQFKVRPPRRGGRVMVGAWVRIRIDYGTRRR